MSLCGLRSTSAQLDQRLSSPGGTACTAHDKLMDDSRFNPKAADMVMRVILKEAKKTLTDEEKTLVINALGADNYNINDDDVTGLNDAIENKNSKFESAMLSGVLVGGLLGSDFLFDLPLIARSLFGGGVLGFGALMGKEIAGFNHQNQIAHEKANNIWNQMKSNASATV